MYEFKLDFILDRDAEGKITGFTVIAQKQGEAEFFCKDFGLAFSVNKANFFLAGDALVLVNLACPFQPAKVAFHLKLKVYEELEKFYLGGGQFMIRQPLHPDTIGFRIVHV
ncbi:MAG: hypothetical protein UX02_C0001G0304 [Candidatus Moranbacteria bacterium GW2011_GWC1_45_18]|nr:MAG: hypothetical protein UT79_C0002G0093 [Candidatus Moranbacteria bacterium GW2011_GWC2_40_12]KKT33756.1 MAG: hypothetical protein UW19_C0005G0002 [Candidatus Moranbacteria bacterium GW2011_GWF2_44_10]KKU00856.1 MAG: hypothetical protein UX02_C0001G0304 [Candidatus Moranbacteria bacterium GW2011_GWC1_45_18]OGI23812.1 MAG: hypothetical protein A2194_02145 [Candidatus Moranbacteria bacterium RIFOXYA1_FULL_44_8]OGI36963.1 MAG: hypothetical protein A2407_04925 [Candidatus Moranbacteria bacteri